MRSFFEWFETSRIDLRRPWLILGKGPSFSKRNQFDLSGYFTLSLNHAVREQPVAVAHMIDYDVVDAAERLFYRTQNFYCCPGFLMSKMILALTTWQR